MKKLIFKTLNLPKRQPVVAALAILFSVGLTGCESLNGCGFGDDVKPDILQCSTSVTVVSAGCATGAFQNKWLQLDNGDLLQPFGNQTYITAIEPGQRYQIGYEVMKRDRRYDGQVICQALPPDGTPVNLLCMTPLDAPGPDCNTYATATNVICGAGVWANIWLKLDNGTYLQPWHNASGITQIREGARYKLGYSQMARDNRYNNVVVCLALPADSMAWNPEVVSITCLEEAGTPPIKTGK